MVANRRGATTGGCLVTMLILGAAGYSAIQIGEPYYKFYQFKDAAQQEARFASLRSDDAIKRNLTAAADTLGLPEAAYHFKIVRGPNAIHIQSSYDDSWTVGPYTRPVHYDLDVEDTL